VNATAPAPAATVHDVPAPGTGLARWTALHAGAFLAAFLATALAVAWAPETMVAAYARWATVMQAAGARTADDLGSAAAVFRHVLVMNAAAIGLFAAVAYVGQAVLALPFAGAFYALVALLAPHAIGRPLAPLDWLLVGLEAGMLVMAASVAAAIGGHRFAFDPNLRGLAAYWRRGWRRWWPTPVAPWHEVRAAWGVTAGWMAAGLALVWLAGAALEAFPG